MKRIKPILLVVGFLLALALPVRATTDTIGNTDGHDDFGADFLVFANITASDSGTLQTLGINVYNAIGHMNLGLYNEAGTRIANSTIVVPVANWNDLSVTGGVNIVAGTKYTIAVGMDTNIGFYKQVVASCYKSSVTFGSLPATIPTCTNYANTFNMRMTYGAAAPPVASTTNLYLNGTEGNYNAIFGSTINITATLNVTNNFKILKNNTEIASGNSPLSVILDYSAFSPSDYNITTYFDGNETTNKSSTTYYISISKDTTTHILHISINGTETDNTINYPAVANVSGWYTPTDIDGCGYTCFQTYVNGSALTFGLYTGIGSYNFSVLLVHQNYSATAVIRYLSILYKIPPNILINTPNGNTTINSVMNNNVSLNYSVTTGATLDKCSYELDGAGNISLGSCVNSSLIFTSVGTHTLKLYANDTYGNQNSSSATFLIDFLNEFRLKDNKTGGYVSAFQVLFFGDNVTRSTTNGSLLFKSYDLTLSNVTQRLTFAAAGYNTTNLNYTFNTTTLYNETIDIYPASIRIIAYDEDDAYSGTFTNLTFDVNLANTTVSYNWQNQTELFVYWNQTPTGIQVITTISSNGYNTRRYYIDINENTALKLNAYLLKTSNSWLVRFAIRDQTDAPVPSAVCTAFRFFNGSYQEVGQEISDVSGTCAITLNPFAIYKIKVEKSGYVTTYSTLQPSSQDYRIYLSSPTALGFTSVLANISIRILPETLGLNATINNFSCTVSSMSSDLEYVGFNISNSTHVFYYGYLDTSPSGTEFIVSIDLTNQTGNLAAKCFFKKTGYNEFNLTYTYYYRTFTEGEVSLPAIFRNFGNLGYSPITTGLIALIISGLVGGFVSTRNGLAGAVTVLIMLALFTFWLAWFDWRVYILVLMTVISAIFLRSGV